ncbi:MAG: hypothetical protein HQK66_14110 [Desulfamplus sp.]|nr:hypothetical protein [Desulfamplus sp.]
MSEDNPDIKNRTAADETDKEPSQVLSSVPPNTPPGKYPPGTDRGIDRGIDRLKESQEFDIALVDATLREYMHSLYFDYRDSKDREEFMENIRKRLLGEFSHETAMKLIKIYEAYIDCELSIQEQIPAFGTPSNEADFLVIQNEIFTFRKNALGDELADRLFGDEYYRSIFKIMGKKIYDNDSLYGAEKEMQLKQLAAEIYGNDSGREPFDKTGESLYREKLLLYKKDMAEMNQAQRKQLIREFRKEYLSMEEIEAIEAAEDNLEISSQRDRNYDIFKNDILADPFLDADEKQEKIYELQQQIYGDMADEIRRAEEASHEYTQWFDTLP